MLDPTECSLSLQNLRLKMMHLPASLSWDFCPWSLLHPIMQQNIGIIRGEIVIISMYTMYQWIYVTATTYPDSCWATCAWCYVQNRYIVSNHQNITFASCDSRNTNGFNWVDCLGYWKKTWANGEANICSNSFLVAFYPKYQVHYPLKTHASFCLQLMVHVAPVGSGA